MDLQNLSDDELREYAKSEKALVVMYDTRQATFKVLANSFDILEA